MNNNVFDAMSINHFLIYTILGIIFPNKWLLAVIIMISWEIFEMMLVKHTFLYEMMKKHWIIPEIYWNENKINKLSDMVFNVLGYAIGSLVGTRRAPRAFR